VTPEGFPSITHDRHHVDLRRVQDRKERASEAAGESGSPIVRGSCGSKVAKRVVAYRRTGRVHDSVSDPAFALGLSLQVLP